MPCSISGPPCKPLNFSVGNPGFDKLMVFWIRCFHGGFPQTFVIQYSTDGSEWTNASFVEGGLSNSIEPLNTTLTGLQPNTQYNVRIYAFNVKGASDETDAIDIKTTQSGKLVPGIRIQNKWLCICILTNVSAIDTSSVDVGKNENKRINVCGRKSILAVMNDDIIVKNWHKGKYPTLKIIIYESKVDGTKTSTVFVLISAQCASLFKITHKLEEQNIF